MKTTANINIPTNQEMIAHYEKVLNVCNKEIEYLTHPELYGCCLCKCNSIVINKERMMTVTTKTTDGVCRTTYEFSPLYPTYFSPEVARDIVKNDIYRDINDNRIQMEIVGKLEYYTLLKGQAEKSIELFKGFANC